MAFFEELSRKAKDMAAVAADKAKDVAAVAADKARETTEKTKISVAIAGEQREIEKNYRMIGEWFINEYDGELPEAVQELADAAHISLPYMHRLFQTHLGLAPGQYIAKIRMEEAKTLLRSGSLSMGAVAREMGFSSQQHFSRQFRSVCGMTPSEYVRSLR